MTNLVEPKIGMVLQGYCQGYFGRDSYDAKRIEVVAVDYIVVREWKGPSLLNTTEWDGNIPAEWLIEEEYDG